MYSLVFNRAILVIKAVLFELITPTLGFKIAKVLDIFVEGGPIEVSMINFITLFYSNFYTHFYNNHYQK